jgi:dTDP-glucose 4,6-dehydratase
VDDHCDAIEAVLERGTPGEVYNIGGRAERANIDIARTIVAATGRSEALFRHVKDRLGHDRRYAMNIDHIERTLGWRPTRMIEAELPKLVTWYAEHRGWWQAIKSGEYRDYYARMYGARLAGGVG